MSRLGKPGWPTRTLLLVAVAAVCFGATESRVPRREILGVEGSINNKFRSNVADPYNLLGDARGTYLEYYGAVFTFEVELIYVSAPSPFKPTISPAEIQMIHDRKQKKMADLRQAMYSQMASAATMLDSLPPNQQISMEAILWYYSWENSRDLPKRLFMTVEKDKLLEATAKHANPASVIEEQER